MQNPLRSLAVLLSLFTLIMSVAFVPQLANAKEKPSSYDAVIWETTAKEAEKFLAAVKDLDLIVERGKWDKQWDSLIEKADALKVIEFQNADAEKMVAYARELANRHPSENDVVITIVLHADEEGDPPADPTSEPVPPTDPTSEPEPTVEPTPQPDPPSPCPSCHYHPRQVIGIWL